MSKRNLDRDRNIDGRFLPGNKYARITELPDDKYEHFREMLKKGMSSSYLAKIIQEEWGLHNDVARISMIKMIDRYRRDELTAVEVMEEIDPRTLTTMRERAKKTVDLMEVYSEMIEMQLNHVRIAYKRMEQTNFPLGALNDAIQTLNRITKDYGELGIRAGFVQRMLQEDTGERHVPKHLDKVFRDDAIRQELIGVVDDMIRELDEEAAVLEGEVIEEDQDGGDE